MQSMMCKPILATQKLFELYLQLHNDQFISLATVHTSKECFQPGMFTEKG